LEINEIHTDCSSINRVDTMIAIFDPRRNIRHRKIKQIIICNPENEKKTASTQRAYCASSNW